MCFLSGNLFYLIYFTRCHLVLFWVQMCKVMIVKILLINLMIGLNICLNADILTLNPSFQASSSFCVQDLQDNSSGVYFQNKFTKAVYFTKDWITITHKTVIPIFAFKQMKCIENSKLQILSHQSQTDFIYWYDVITNSISSFTASDVKDIDFISKSSNDQSLVYLKNSAIRIRSTPLSALSTEISYSLDRPTSVIRCAKSRNKSLDGYCFMISDDKSKIMYFNQSYPSDIFQRQMSGITAIELSEMNERIYVSISTGQIKEYSLRKGSMFFERSTMISSGSSIWDLEVNELRNQIIYLNSARKVGIIQLITGYEIGSKLDQASFSNNITKISVLSRNSFVLFNPSQFSATIFLYNITAIVSAGSPIISNPLQKLCLNDLQYYNTTSSECESCQKGCNLCDQQSSVCLQCTSGYFMQNNSCFDCLYGQIKQQNYALCFQQSEISVLAYTNAITPALTTTISISYSVISGSGLFFLLLRYINFWSLISIYYFLNIDAIPYFLLEILSHIFNILEGSMFEYLGIDISSVNMGINSDSITQKMKYTQITTDFLAANFQSIVTYIYSLILICILYNGIKKWFKKFNIHLFEKVKLQACLEQFIGLFIPLLVPLYFFLQNLGSNNFLSKLNNALFILFLGIALIFPFFYLVLTAKRITDGERIKMIKKQLNKQGKMDQSTIFRSTKFSKSHNQKKKSSRKILIHFMTQEETQNFLYCLNSLWSPFLVGFSSPLYFLIFGALINILGLWNAFYAEEWKFNQILQKILFLTYHMCFVFILLIPSANFFLSIAAFILIMFGGVHQLLTTVAQKLYFLYLVLIGKGIIKKNKIAAQNQCKKAVILKDEVNLKQQIFQGFNIQVENARTEKIQRSSFKNIEINPASDLTQKKIIKMVKKIKGESSIMKNTLENNVQNVFTWNQQKSLQHIQLSNQKGLENKNKKVKFSNVQNEKTKINEKQINKSMMRSDQNKNQKNGQQIKSISDFRLLPKTIEQRKALFDQEFVGLQENESNDASKSIKQVLSAKMEKSLLNDFNQSKASTKKTYKFLKMNSHVKIVREFSKTEPSTVPSQFSIRER